MLKLEVSEKDIIAAMEAELDLATKRLRIPGEKPPYFVSYLLRRRHQFEIWARFGALYGEKENRSMDCYAEVRVGNPQLDQSMDGGLTNFEREEANFWADNHPLDGDREVLRYSLRMLTEDKYREALEGYYKKKSYLVSGGPYPGNVENFYCERARRHRDRFAVFVPNLKRDAAYILPVSELFKKYSHLRSSYVELAGERVRSYYLNSEGSRIIMDQVFYKLEMHAIGIDDRGLPLRRQKIFHYLAPGKAPTEKVLEETVRLLCEDLKELIHAPLLTPHHGPVLLGPEASGLFFHEVLGHRLEAERLLAEGEGRTLKDKIGERIMPEFLSVYDDPTQKEFRSQPLLGHYKFDCEGVPAKRVNLIERGVLRDFLRSRSPAEAKGRSNGHGRTELFRRPMARMANLFVQSHISATPAEMEERLRDEAKRQKRAFGLMIDQVAAGETDTSNYDFQVFKGEPERIYRVDCKSGQKSLVRGLDFIGTPLSAVNKIIAAGKNPEVFNSWCTAESGDVRVAAIAPSLLFSDMELQRSKEKKGPLPIFPTFWASRGKKKGRRS